MCCENARSHHSPFSRFPPRSMFITPRSHHSSLLVQCSARAPRSVLSPNSSFSSFHQFPRSPRSLLTLSARSHHSAFHAPRALITPRFSFTVHFLRAFSAFPAPRTPRSSLPVPLVHSLAHQLSFIAPCSHYSSLLVPRAPRSHHSPLLVPRHPVLRAPCFSFHVQFSSFRFPAFTLSARAHHSPLLVLCSAFPRSAHSHHSAFPAPRSSLRALLVSPLSLLVPRRPRAPPLRAFLVSTPITPPNHYPTNLHHAPLSTTILSTRTKPAENGRGRESQKLSY